MEELSELLEERDIIVLDGCFSKKTLPGGYEEREGKRKQCGL
jgi:hypothetical protein